MTKANIRGKIRWGIFGIIALLFASSIFVAPQLFNKGIDWANNNVHLGLPRITERDFRLGLDLQGGAHLVYEADVSNIPAGEEASAVEGVRDVIEKRINGIGVSEAQVQTTQVGKNRRIIVELPGVSDVEQAISMIGATPILEFKEINDAPARELTAEEQKQIDTFNVDAKVKATDLLKKIKDGINFEDVAKESSEDETSKNNGGYLNYVNTKYPYAELFIWAQTVKEGDISKTLVTSTEGFNILKRGTERDGEKEVQASHILICYLGSQNCNNEQYTKEEALAKAQEIYNQANADNFEQLAKDNSTDPSVAQNNGDLGWFGTGQMIPEFEKATFDAQKGQIIGPVETAFGYHVIYKKDERNTKEYEIWRILVKTEKATDILPPQDPWKNTDLSGKNLKHSEVVSDQQTGAIQVALNFDDDGKDLFADITKRNIGKQVAIFLDNDIISAPNVQTAITDGRAVITGSFNLQDAKLLSQRLNAGALPVPVNLISQQTVGATLGAKSVQASLFAGIVGLLLVMIFMLIYYRLPGLLSVIALALYITLTLALFKSIGVTLSLAGIAGFIISIGMAIDANVLIFERLKEELISGKSLKAGVEEGFKRAWSSIRDSNISTLITCILLIWFGTSFVQGFAVTLGIGVLLSMFSAITVTRVLLRFVVPWFKKRDGGWLFLGTFINKEQK
ncbi:MAG: protein translocase subunit SecD [Candidatus Magasanikbacteria bacterium CG_4_10_14_0_8_um_filter_32_14]|uniref:Protein translocase subunit SecD n=1 Tax=Candidatus Magasanikbacteria bacterium CG_4_10_14_0_8_um_filter_32_14 TaxID=1974640 RepID=A0A2M7R9Q0_9BACT|nr:MAG: protein translocase subunit SecD [Candidatus Magasanikbacteria bacterium CG_4_10_14_0_8_um_filter_32_14]